MAEFPHPQSGGKPSTRNTVTDRPKRDNPVLEFITPKLDDDEWDALQGRLWDIVRYNVVQRSQLDENLLVWNDLYEGITPDAGAKDWPWPNAANLHIPMTSELVDSLHARLSKAALGVSPIVLCKPKDDASKEITTKIERYYDSFTKKTNLDDTINQVIFLSLRDGVGLEKVGWEERKRKIRVRKYVPILDDQGEPVLDPIKGKPIVNEVVETIDLTEFDDVRAVPVEFKDFYLIPAHAYALDRFGSGAAKGGMHRLWMRFDEIQRLANTKTYRQSAVDKIRDNIALERTPDTSVTIEDQIALIQPYEDEKEFELFEIYMSHDLDGDGYDEECKFVMAFKWGIMLEAEVFSYWHQQRPFIPCVPWQRPRRFYGFSVVHRLEPLQREINTIRNQRVDTVSLYLSPPLKIAKSAIIRGDVSQAWGPGARMEVESMEDIDIMKMPEINPSAWTEETLIRQEAERLIGLFDVNTPRGTGSRRTRTEVNAIQQESMVRFDYMMKYIKRHIVDLYDMVHKLKIQYMPEEEEFESGLDPQTGQPIKEVITRQEMTQANFEFQANGDLPVADQQQRREDAYFLFQTLYPIPLIQSSMAHQYQLAKDLLVSYDRRNIESIIGTPEEAMQLQQMMQQQQQAEAAQPPLRIPGGGAGGQKRPGGAGR